MIAVRIKNATRGFCLHTTLSLQPSLVLRALGAGAEHVNRPNLFPKRESLCNFWGCLQLVQKQANCSMTDGQDIALLGELAPGQNQHGHVPPGSCYQLMQLRSKLDSSSYLICLFRLNHHFAVGKSSKIKLQKLTCVSYCLNLPKGAVAALPTSSGTAWRAHSGFFHKLGHWRWGCSSCPWGEGEAVCMARLSGWISAVACPVHDVL